MGMRDLHLSSTSSTPKGAQIRCQPCDDTVKEVTRSHRGLVSICICDGCHCGGIFLIASRTVKFVDGRL
eukprot:6174271-Pleurochrysis_carterae.AAC.1